jgi:flagella basal body P-ring formation protein FlgA
LLAAPRVIRRGQQVSIRSATTGVQVRMGGRALEGGAIGDLVRVRNASSGRIVEGRVVGPGRVRVER